MNANTPVNVIAAYQPEAPVSVPMVTVPSTIDFNGIQVVASRKQRKQLAKLAHQAQQHLLNDDFGKDAYLVKFQAEMRSANAEFQKTLRSFDGVNIRALKGFAMASTAAERVALTAKLAEEGGLKPVIVKGLDPNLVAAALSGKSKERQRRIGSAMVVVANAIGDEAVSHLDLEKVRELALTAGMPLRRVRDALHGLKLYRKVLEERAPRKIRVLLLFDGISASSIAMHQLDDRFEVVAVAEIGDHPSAVIAHHYPDKVNLGDITKVDWEAFKEKFGEIDLIVAGWPCQDISRANPEQAGLAGPRSRLFFKLMEIAKILQPKFMIGENVAALFDANMRADLKAVFDHFDAAGYRVDADYIDPTQFGVPMARPRFYGLAVRKDVARKLPKVPVHRHPTAQKALTAIGQGKFGGYLSCFRFGRPRALGSYLIPNADPSLLMADHNLAAALDKWDRKGRLPYDRGAFEVGPDHANAIPEVSHLPFIVATGMNDTLCWWSQNFGLGGTGLKYNEAYTFTRRTGFGVVYEGCVRKYAIEEIEALFGFPAGYTDVPHVGGKKVRKKKAASYNVRLAALGNTMEVNSIKHALEAVLLADWMAE